MGKIRHYNGLQRSQVADPSMDEPLSCCFQFYSVVSATSLNLTLAYFIISTSDCCNPNVCLAFPIQFINSIRLSKMYFLPGLVFLLSTLVNGEWNTKDFLKREHSLVKPYQGINEKKESSRIHITYVHLHIH